MPLDITGYELTRLEKDINGKYIFPNMPCGILPFFINNEDQIVWGCVETNRVGVTAIAPPAGTQDIIALKNNHRLTFEVAKPLKENNYEFLQSFVGKPISNEIYQNLITSLIQEGFDVYIEHPLATAAHETKEEHGIDLHIKEGAHSNLLVSMFEFDPQTILAKRGTTTQKIFAAHLTPPGNVTLNYTDKIEEKIDLNKGRPFYEKGIWTTLEDLKLSLEKEQQLFKARKEAGILPFNLKQIALIEAEFKAYASRIELIEKIESSIKTNLNCVIASKANLPSLDFINLQKSKNTENSPMNSPYNLFAYSPKVKRNNASEEKTQDLIII
ncbi:Uncharacterised protein [Legionella busanensis]|uniref:Uncharacterized protein n=1 Tax=Legionella busanensis TaxID=190655 RepID=A0A378JL95_9GAMM|nr:hypothetical protein [Legionella busanensis]STX51458.1 Uncharacterised protein [Legionella busanensis]